MALDLNRQKYLAILKSDGFHGAITALHHDMEKVEYQSFEGDMKDESRLHGVHEAMRAFSRELWQLALDQGPDRDPPFTK